MVRLSDRRESKTRKICCCVAPHASSGLGLRMGIAPKARLMSPWHCTKEYPVFLRALRRGPIAVLRLHVLGTLGSTNISHEAAWPNGDPSGPFFLLLFSFSG